MTSNACLECLQWMSCAKNDVVVVDTLEDGSYYKAWSADRWVCNGCGRSTITGMALRPFWEKHHSKAIVPGGCEVWVIKRQAHETASDTRGPNLGPQED